MHDRKIVLRLCARLALLLWLGGCGNQEEAALGEEPTLGGILNDLPMGMFAVAFPIDMIQIQRGVIDQSGNFSIRLPGGSVLGALLTEISRAPYRPYWLPTEIGPCTGTVDLPTFQAYGLPPLYLTEGSGAQTAFVASIKQVDRYDPKNRNLTPTLVVEYLYADGAHDVEAHVTCGGVKTDATLHLKKAWNAVVTHIVDATVNTAQISVTTEPVPATARWFVIPSS